MFLQVSHSRIECFKSCRWKYKLRYIDKLKTYFNGEPDNPLVIGTALHIGIERDTDTAIKEYYSNYPVIDDRHIEEAIKLEYVIKQCKEILPEGLHEVKIESKEFVGYIDLLVPVPKEEITGDDCCYACTKEQECGSSYTYGDFCPRMKDHEWFDLYDFKYSNNVEGYLDSGQLHEYKYYFEKLNPTKHIRKLYYLFAPKVAIRMKKKNKTNPRDETVEEFRRRLKVELENKKAQLVEIEYDHNKVEMFLKDADECRNAKTFDKNESDLCRWCEFKNYCLSEGKETLDIMNLPENKRRVVESNDKKKIWIYGAPFSGKTYLANRFPDVLMLNTDGNIKYIDAPFVAIKDEVKVEGRLTKRTLAWQVFKDTIAELEKKQNSFKTIVVDLVEDTYEYCRLYMYEQLGITHESDDSFRAWDKVRIEFLSTIKRLMNLDYENIILISHEDTSKDLTRKGGDKITAIKPNIQDKAALKLAGMVDLVCRVIDDEGKRIISFKNSEVVFGGGRLNITANEIPCSYEELMEVYHKATESSDAKTTQVATVVSATNAKSISTLQSSETTTIILNAETPEAVLPTRKVRVVPTEHEKKVEEFKNAAEATPATSEAPVRRRRRVAE